MLFCIDYYSNYELENIIEQIQIEINRRNEYAKISGFIFNNHEKNIPLIYRERGYKETILYVRRYICKSKSPAQINEFLLLKYNIKKD